MSDKKASLHISDLQYPLPIEHRPMWRVSLICIAIKFASNNDGRIKIDKLRVSIWMLIRPQKWEEYFDSLHGHGKELISISSDKSTDKAIELAISKNIIELTNDSVSLAREGEILLNLIKEVQILEKEKYFLNSIKTKLTDKYIKRMLGN